MEVYETCAYLAFGLRTHSKLARYVHVAAGPMASSSSYQDWVPGHTNAGSTAADDDHTDSIDVDNYADMAWAVRVDNILVIGNISTFTGGTIYTWIGLDVGPLVYYPTMNTQRFTPNFHDGCYNNLEALRTLHNHHIRLA